MANTSDVYARIDNDVKARAEAILARFGITPSSAIQMLYSQIILRQGLPFTPRIPADTPFSTADLTRGQLDAEIWRGVESLDASRGVPEDEADAMFAEEFGI